MYGPLALFLKQATAFCNSCLEASIWFAIVLVKLLLHAVNCRVANMHFVNTELIPGLIIMPYPYPAHQLTTEFNGHPKMIWQKIRRRFYFFILFILYDDGGKKIFCNKNLEWPIPPVYLHWIFPILQFEISSLMNWIFFQFETNWIFFQLKLDFSFLRPP